LSYSASEDAVHSLGVIYNFYGDKASSNVLKLKGEYFFYALGKEHADGAITGELFHLHSANRKGNLNHPVFSVGTFRISPDGTIDRFPRLSKIEKEECENTMRDMRARNFALLQRWSLGRI
jgi:hypothetical protein